MSGSGSESAARWLVMVERAYRGSVERQFADVLSLVTELHRQSGGTDLALRGLAASYAVDTGWEPAVRIGGRTVDTLPDPRASVRGIVAAGVRVLVERPDVAALGRSAARRLLPGVDVVEAGGLAACWPSYEQVWFL